MGQAGIASRRKAEELIREGRVKVNDRVVRELGARADLERDRISVDGKPLRIARERAYMLLHKPVGYVTTLSDPEGRATVRDLLRGVKTRVYPVGRLDYHTSGLLLLTDDGDLAGRLMHPRYEIEREYRVKVKGKIDDEALARLREGIFIGPGRPARSDVLLDSERDDKSWLRLTLREGRHHEIRRMCQALGLRVEKLRRVRYGPLKLGHLAPGEFRILAPAEVIALRSAVGLRARSA